MNEQEKLMYGIISNISQTDAPIIFKGGLITRLILQENGFTQIERATKDIDASWIDNPPTMENLSDTINRSLGEFQERFMAVPERNYKELQAAGIAILEKETGDKILSMDIDIKSVAGSRIYHYGEASIKGVLVNEILVDKIMASSSDAVYKWRTKDVLDVYMLSRCVKINTKEIFDTSAKLNKNFQSFDAFYNKKDEIYHAYERLKGITGKPDFEELYSYLKIFYQPFAKCDYTEKNWNNQKITWVDEKSLSMDNWKKRINEEKKFSTQSKKSEQMKNEIEK